MVVFKLTRHSFCLVHTETRMTSAIISPIWDLCGMFLAVHIAVSLANSAVVCAILDLISGLEPVSQMMLSWHCR